MGRVLCAAACLIVLVGCGRHDSAARKAVDHYFEQVDAVQKDLGPSVHAAQSAYAHFLPGRRGQETKLRSAQRTMLALRVRIAKLHPPAQAARIHRQLLQLLDLELDIGIEVLRLDAYVPRAQRTLQALAPASRTLQRELAAASTRKAQAIALARYAGAVDAARGDLDALEPPSTLEAWSREQSQRLADVASTTRTLRRAILYADTRATRVALARLRLLLERGVGVSSAQRVAIVEYNARRAAISRLGARIERERAKLEQRLR